MADYPETRISLILRLAQSDDVQAWHEFCELYAPLVYRLAVARGMQPADAEDVTQDTLFAVARAAERFEPDPGRARFRTWLSRIARNLIADFFAGRAKRPLSQVLSDRWWQSVCEPSQADETFETVFGQEHRRAVLEMAARRVQQRVSTAVWQAFFLTAVQHQPAESVASELGQSLGAIYVARCRVLKMLRHEAQLLEHASQLSEPLP